jgi:O-antigen/teichoic acid export membrane protein
VACLCQVCAGLSSSLLQARPLWRHVLETGGASAAGVAASTLSLFITARYLGPEGRGIYAAAYAWVALAATLGSLSLGQVVIHHAAGRPVDVWLPETVGTCLAITAGATAVVWLAVVVVYGISGGQFFDNLNGPVLFLAFLALPFLMAVQTNRYILNAMDRLRTANGAQLVGATLGVIGVVFFVAILGYGVPGALLATLLGVGGTGLIGWWVTARSAGHLRPRRAVAARLLRGSAQLHLSAIGNYLLAQSSVLILNHFRPPAETGYYQLAVQLFGLTLLASDAISTVAFGLVAQRGPDDAWPEQRRLLAQALGVVMVIAVAGYLAAPLGIRIVAGAEFLPAVPLFRIILPALLGATFSTIMASQWIGRGLFWQAAVITLAVGAVSVLCDFIFIPQYGMYGALFSTLVAYGASVVINGVMAMRIQQQWRSRRVGLT